MGFVLVQAWSAGLDLCLQIGMRPAVHACFILIQSQGWPWHFSSHGRRWEGPARLSQQLSSLCFSVLLPHWAKQVHVAKPSISGAGKYNPMWRYGGPGFRGRNECMMNNHPVYHIPKSKCTGSVNMPSGGSQALAWESALGGLHERTRTPLTCWE